MNKQKRLLLTISKDFSESTPSADILLLKQKLTCCLYPRERIPLFFACTYTFSFRFTFRWLHKNLPCPQELTKYIDCCRPPQRAAPVSHISAKPPEILHAEEQEIDRSVSTLLFFIKGAHFFLTCSARRNASPADYSDRHFIINWKVASVPFTRQWCASARLILISAPVI